MVSYKTLNPHPKVIQKCMDDGYLPDPFTIETTEQMLLGQIGQGKAQILKDPAAAEGEKPRTHKYIVETVETKERPIKRSITKVFRVKNPEGEFLYFTEYLEGNQFGGKYVDLSRPVGKYEEPMFAIDQDRATGAKTVTGIRKKEARYEIPFGGKFTDPSTGEETTLDKLPLDPLCKFYAITIDRKYALPSIGLEEFTSKSFNELVEYGKTGKWPEVAEAPASRKRVKVDE